MFQVHYTNTCMSALPFLEYSFNLTRVTGHQQMTPALRLTEYMAYSDLQILHDARNDDDY